MTTITATRVDARDLAELVGVLDELQALAPPPGPLRFTVGGRGGSHATNGHVCIRGRDVGEPWVRGTLAHEYAHVIDPEGPDGLNRRAARLAAPMFVLAAVAGALALAGYTLAGKVGLALVVTAAVWALRGIRNAYRAQEYRVDRRAAQLVGAEHVEAMLQHHAERRDRFWWFWRHFDSHPHPADRLAALRATSG